MKIFPENNYSFKLNNDSSLALSELENQTFSKEQYVADWNSKTFIGEIAENKFELKLSKKLIGQICVLQGKLENETGTLEVRTGRIFKIIFIAIVLFALFGIITAIFQKKLILTFQLILTILIMRFILLELAFHIVSKSGLIKLTQIIGITELKKTLHNNI